MKRIAFILPFQLQEDGTLEAELQPELFQSMKQIGESSEITLIVRRIREKSWLEAPGAKILYDMSLPDFIVENDDFISYMQLNYESWVNAKMLPKTEFDWVILWGGLSPWGLRTAIERVPAKRRALYLLHRLSPYLLTEDREFYQSVAARFDRIFAAGKEIQEDFLHLFGKSGLSCKVLAPPTDRERYLSLSKETIALPYCREHINLLAAGRMCVSSRLEELPRLASELHAKYPALRWFILGEGPRLPRFWQQIAVYDADSYITLLGKRENPFPFLSRCDALVICDGELESELAKAAEVFNIPVIRFSEAERQLPALVERNEYCKRRKNNENQERICTEERCG